MLSSYILALAVAGSVHAATPNAFEPASSGDLIVAFGSQLATNGVNIPRANTAKAPTIGTSQKLFGTYAVILADPDIPGAPTDSKTGQFLHWIQAGLESSSTSTTVAGQTIFELQNPSNASAFAPYVQPSPPNRALTTHRYIELLVNTTGDSAALKTLMTAGATRTNFSALAVVNAAGKEVLFANWFNVTNEDALAAAGGSVNATATGSGNGTSSGLPINNGADTFGKSGVMIAGLVAFAAAVASL
ncbi:PEBP-like protein [Glarea lozoyensis ATCC 20868]|uniref:PEBP-like protein n=1 Tax=Glarea lozoyensis (strain ATCC 20868 / MF5171) TaxID=1116229 RepID=S3DDE0_GLAL2|nr:PEBP-like protein [Glarea lozoyensis ATCC 20868]EPE30006.1 PEBP-like protein [Glarea lozoyensis ATCC 20868]